MTFRQLWTVGLLLLSGSALRAQDISGVWQGTLAIDSATQRRIVLKVEKGEHDRLKATLYSIDEGPEPYPVTSITREGSTVKFSIDSRELSYTGTLSRDGNAISGTLTQGGSLSLRFDRATNKSAWPLDASHNTAALTRHCFTQSGHTWLHIGPLSPSIISYSTRRPSSNVL